MHTIFNCGKEIKDSFITMAFIQIAYCISVPVFLLLSWFTKRRHFFVNVLAVSNVLLIGYAVFLVRQIIGYYQLSKQLHVDYRKLSMYDTTIDMARVTLVILLPFFALIKPLQKSSAYCIVLLALLYWNNPVFSWNTYDLFLKITAYCCLFCSGYALLWLMNRLPYQSPVV
jgi:hypothetical protein